MSKFLPTSGFKWIDLKKFDVKKYSIHIGNVKKLMPNFFEKAKYVIHYENFN